jgi:hypothetical protein
MLNGSSSCSLTYSWACADAEAAGKSGRGKRKSASSEETFGNRVRKIKEY